MPEFKTHLNHLLPKSLAKTLALLCHTDTYCKVKKGTVSHDFVIRKKNQGIYR